MCSVEIVDVINALRGPGKAELAHDNFMKKIVAHPGIAHVNFYGGYFDPNKQQRPCYYLPKREADYKPPKTVTSLAVYQGIRLRQEPHQGGHKRVTDAY